MPAVELDAARLVGGSEADRSRVLERVHEYLEANASFDWGQLQDNLERRTRGSFLQLERSHLQGPRALDPALAVLSTKRQERLLDAIRPRRRRIERSRRRLVRTAHAVGMDRLDRSGCELGELVQAKERSDVQIQVLTILPDARAL